MHPIRLLTTRPRIALAMCLTALVLVQKIRGLYLHRATSPWLLGPPLLHGWALITVNVGLYGYICWVAFWLIRGTATRERFFMVGWFVGLLLWPLKLLWPRSAVTVGHIGAFGLAVALFAALALLLDHRKRLIPAAQRRQPRCHLSQKSLLHSSWLMRLLRSWKSTQETLKG